MVDEVLDLTFEEIPTKEELDETPNLFYAGIVYEDQCTETVSITKLVPLRHVTELTEKELIKLKTQIHPGSLFYGDYENTLGIERKELSDVCDCYIEALESESQYEWLTRDTPENFAEYCMDYYCRYKASLRSMSGQINATFSSGLNN